MRDRILRAVRRRWNVVRHRGDRVECPLCGGQFTAFAPRWNTADAICWRCGSHERHRALYVYLTELRPELLSGTSSLLHFAPEWGIQPLLRGIPGLRYVTCDLNPDYGDLTIDITDIALDDASFGAVICSHVLEHVEDDRQAMAELNRVVAPGGWAIVMVPLDPTRAQTLEDPAVTTPEQRREAYWQDDHVRLYGRDLADRLSGAGFDVQVEAPAALLPADRAERLRLLEQDAVFLCRRL